jgi:transposase
MQIANEIEAVEQAMKQTTDKRMYERYLAVRLRLEGQTLEQISKTLHRTRKTIGGYLHKYKGGGLGALAMDHSPGKPSKLTEQQTDQLTKVLTGKRPADVGFEAKYTWTLKLATHYIEREFGQTFSERGLSLLLHRLGFSARLKRMANMRALNSLGHWIMQREKCFTKKVSLTMRRRSSIFWNRFSPNILPDKSLWYWTMDVSTKQLPLNIFYRLNPG